MIALLVVILVGLLTAAYWDYTQDDVFITYTYSRNIAQGEGFVFNPGERVQGTTTPLYTLLMAGAYLLTPDLLHAGNLLSALFLLLSIALAVRLIRPFTSRYAQAAAAITLAAAPLVYVSFGMETLLYSALLMLAFWLWSRGHRLEAMLAAAALTWTRADGVVLAGALGLATLPPPWPPLHSVGRGFRGGEKYPSLPSWWGKGRGWGGLLALTLAYLIGIAPWFGFAWAYFGTPLPQTFRAKEELFRGTLFWTDGWNWWKAFYGNNPLTLLALPLIAVGAWRAVRLPTLRPLALWPALYLAGYTALNVTAFWYYTPLLAVLVLLAALGGDTLARRVIRAGWPRRAVIAGALIVVGLTALLAAVRAWNYRELPPRMVTYRLVGEWIEHHTTPDSTLLVKDLGIVGYYARRHTLDSFGLIVPDMHFTDDTYAAAKFKPDYVVATQYWEMQQLVAMDWFSYHYRPVAQFSTPGDTEFSPMTVYRRRLPLDTPAEMIEGFDLPLTCTVELDPGDPLPDQVSARLLSDSGDIAAEAAHPFLWDQYPADRAADPETLIEQIALPLDVPPGSYRWELACDVTTSGTIRVLPIADSPDYRSVAATWPDFARLDGALLPDGAETWSGGALTIALHWTALGPAATDYSLFVHLVDQSGRVVAQSDGFPRGRPVTVWQAGETIIDVREILLPPTLPPGTYQVRIGWYDWRSEDYPRVPLANGADALTLPLMVRHRWPGGSGVP